MFYCEQGGQGFIKLYVRVVSAAVFLAILTEYALSLGTTFELFRLPFGLSFALRSDDFSMALAVMFAVVWFITAEYAFEYMSHGRDRRKFFGTFLFVIGCLIGVVLADNLVTLYMFFELMTLACYVLVTHEKSGVSMKAGRKLLYYSIFGAALGLIGILYMTAYTDSYAFTAGGIPQIAALDRDSVLFFTLLAVVGFGCKAGLFPLHSWLSAAHPVAPAPASAILSAIITKGGVVAIIRILYFVVGGEVFVGSYVQQLLTAISLLTIFMGSMLALRERQIKKRLAYSTVSQVSYVLFGLFLFSINGFVGAILHIVAHATAKSLLFLSAGTIIHKAHLSDVRLYKGLGKCMPKTFILFTVGGLSLVGVPFTAGFVSKWYLASGSLGVGSAPNVWGTFIIIVSAVLTAGYLLSVTADAFFGSSEQDISQVPEALSTMLTPMTLFAVFTVVVGVYPAPIIDFATYVAQSLIGG